MTKRKIDLSEELPKRSIDMRKSLVKQLKTTRKKFRRCLITMRMLIMFLRRRRMPRKTTFKMFWISLKKRIKLCNNKLKVKISIWQNLKKTIIIFRTRQTNKTIFSLKNLQKREKSSTKRLNIWQLKSPREKELSYQLKTKRKALSTRSRIKTNHWMTLKLKLLQKNNKWSKKLKSLSQNMTKQWTN